MNIEQDRVDSAVSIAKGIVGALPVVGGLFAEIIGMTIPNQRIDRIVGVLNELQRRISEVEIEQIKSNKYALDLFEDGIIQAARSLTELRNRYIAIFIKNCISVESETYGTKKKLFYILQDLTDLDIEILLSIEHWKDRGMRHKIQTEFLSYSEYNSLSKEEQFEYDTRREAWGLHMATLERHGLISAEIEKPGMEYDPRSIDRKTGLPKITGYKITNLGKLILQSIGEPLRENA